MVIPHARKNFLWVVDVFIRVSECTVLMHTTTCSLRLGYKGVAQDASVVYCICGFCGSLRSGSSEWLHLDMSVVAAWRTHGLQVCVCINLARNGEVSRPRGMLTVVVTHFSRQHGLRLLLTIILLTPMLFSKRSLLKPLLVFSLHGQPSSSVWLLLTHVTRRSPDMPRAVTVVSTSILTAILTIAMTTTLQA